MANKPSPQPAGVPKVQVSKGGLGRGLASLIPSATPIPSSHGPSNNGSQPANGGLSGARSRPYLGDTAANVILGDSTQKTQPTQDAPQNSLQATYDEIPIGLIAPNEKNPRQVFDEDELAELAHSIREFGMLQPIVVRPNGENYELVMGERRWRAAAKAGLKKIPAIVRHAEDSTMLRDALLENIHRVQLNPLEEAAAYQQLLEEFDVTQEELAQRLGRSRPVITNMIRLLQLPVAVQRRVAAGVLSAGHARAILGLKAGSEAQEQLADRVVAEGLSVRATEEAVTMANRGDTPTPKAPRIPAPQPEYLTQAAQRWADEWDTKVTVSMGKRKGKIVVEFGDRDDFDRIMALIDGRDS